MNKKFLSVVLFGALMAGSSVTFTGCIDNDEPAGIEDLRGAKAELLRAKVAVETANAALINAQATETLAKAKKEEAIALEKQYLAEKQKLENEIQAARDEEEKARLQAKIEETNAKLEQNKLAWEAELLTSKAELAKAQKAYEDAMKALELSKEYLSDDELKVLENVQNQYNRTYAALYSGSYYVIVNGQKKTIEVTEGESAKGKLDEAYDSYRDVVKNPENYVSEASLQEELLEAQTEYDKIANELAIKQETLKALESGDAYTAWLALKDKYNAKIDSLNAVLADKKTKQAEIIASEANHSIKGLQEAIGAVEKIINDKAEVAGKADSTFVVSDAIRENLDEIDNGFIKYDKASGIYTAQFKNGGDVLALAAIKNDKQDKPNATEYATLMDNVYGFADGNNSKYKVAVGQIDAAIKAVNDAKAAVNPNEMAYAKEIQAEAKKTMDAAQKVAETAIDTWEKAKESYNSGVTEYSDAEFNADKASAGTYVEGAKTATGAELTTYYNLYVTYLNKLKSYGQDLAGLAEVTSADDFKTKANADATLILNTKTTVNKNKALFEAAVAAFGKAGAYVDQDEDLSYDEGDKGVLEQPKDNDSNMGGSQGAYLARVVAYNTATENVEKLAQFDKAVAQLTKWKNSLAEAKNAYTAKYQADIDKVVAAQKSVTEKVVNPIAELKIDVAVAMKKDIEGILAAITKDSDIKEFESLISTLKEEVETLKTDVKEAEETVFEAEKMIELFKEGNLSAQHIIEAAEAKLANAKAAYDRAVTEFNYWSGKLEDITKTLYGKVSAE